MLRKIRRFGATKDQSNALSTLLRLHLRPWLWLIYFVPSENDTKSSTSTTMVSVV